MTQNKTGDYIPDTPDEFYFWERAYVALLNHTETNTAYFQAGLALRKWVEARQNVAENPAFKLEKIGGKIL